MFRHHNRPNTSRPLEPLLLNKEPKPPVAMEVIWNVFHNTDAPIVHHYDVWEVLFPENQTPNLGWMKKNGRQIMREAIEEQFHLNAYKTLDAAQGVFGKRPKLQSVAAFVACEPNV